MKKIVALVLTLVLALSLSAVAFGAPLLTGKTVKGTSQGALQVDDVAVDFNEAVAPTYVDKKVTVGGSVANYEIATGTYAGKYTVVATLGEADVVVYNDTACKSVALYLKSIPTTYAGIGVVATNFGTNCGQMNLTTYDKTKTYYTADDAAAKLYVADKDGAAGLLVNGQIVKVTALDVVANYVVKHNAIPTVKDGKIAGYTCSICKAVAVEAPNFASIPADAQQVVGTNYYFAANAVAAPAEGVESPKTFDAGIAMYVGMSLMAVTGSAVVIGKKKEF